MEGGCSGHLLIPRFTATSVKVAPRGPGDKGRTATVDLRAGKAPSPARDTGVWTSSRDYRAHAGRGARDQCSSGQDCASVAPSHHPYGQHRRASQQVVQLYRLRWRIEQTFRALKSDGLALDDSQVIDAERMFNLAAIGLAGASAPSSSSMPETAVLVLPATSSMRLLRLPSNASRKSSKARPSDRRTRTPLALCFRRLDRRASWWLELLLQTAGTQDHARWLKYTRRATPRLCHCSPRQKSVNPVAHGERSTREARRVRGYGLSRDLTPSPRPSPHGRGSSPPSLLMFQSSWIKP